VLTLDVSKTQGPELHPDVSGKQEPVLVWTFLPHRCLNYVWMCLENGSLCWSGHVNTRGALAAPVRVYCTSEVIVVLGRVYTTGALAARGRVFTKEAFAAPGRCLYNRSLEICPLGDIRNSMEIITEFRELFSNYAIRNSANFRGILGNFFPQGIG
jgi:hypothetical protein